MLAARAAAFEHAELPALALDDARLRRSGTNGALPAGRSTTPWGRPSGQTSSWRSRRRLVSGVACPASAACEVALMAPITRPTVLPTCSERQQDRLQLDAVAGVDAALDDERDDRALLADRRQQARRGGHDPPRLQPARKLVPRSS